MQTAATSDQRSTVRTPSTKGPVPRCHTKAARIATPASRRNHAHSVRLISSPDLLALPRGSLIRLELWIPLGQPTEMTRTNRAPRSHPYRLHT